MPGNEYREIIERLERIENHLTAPADGVFVRIDRMEQRQSAGMWLAGVIIVAVLAVVVPASWSFVTRVNASIEQRPTPAAKP